MHAQRKERKCQMRNFNSAGFIQKNPFKIHKPLQYSAEKQQDGTQLFHTSGKGVQPLL